jgi:hypothetical protein
LVQWFLQALVQLRIAVVFVQLAKILLQQVALPTFTITPVKRSPHHCFDTF